MSIYLDKLAHVQVVINCGYSVAQMWTCKDTLPHYLGALFTQQYAFTNCKLQHLFVLLQDPNQHWPYLEAALYSWSAVAESLAEEEECPILTQFLAKLPVIPYNNNMRVKKVLGHISYFHPLQFKIKWLYYSGDLNSELVLYSSGPKQLAGWMVRYSSKLKVRYSSHDLNSKQIVRVSGHRVFDW